MGWHPSRLQIVLRCAPETLPSMKMALTALIACFHGKAVGDPGANHSISSLSSVGSCSWSTMRTMGQDMQRDIHLAICKESVVSGHGWGHFLPCIHCEAIQFWYIILMICRSVGKSDNGNTIILSLIQVDDRLVYMRCHGQQQLLFWSLWRLL